MVLLISGKGVSIRCMPPLVGALQNVEDDDVHDEPPIVALKLETEGDKKVCLPPVLRHLASVFVLPS
jgi:hypothetical protein